MGAFRPDRSLAGGKLYTGFDVDVAHVPSDPRPWKIDLGGIGLAGLTLDEAYVVQEKLPRRPVVVEPEPRPEPRPEPSRLMMGTEGSSGWPQMIARAHAAYPFRCGRLSDRWNVAAGVAEHVKVGSEPMILIEGWSTSPSTIVALVKRHQPHVKNVELGNEDFYSHKVSASALPGKAAQYARAVVALRAALDQAGLQSVGIAAQLDTGDPGLSNARDGMWLGSTLADALYAAVPDLHRYVRAWTVHPYVRGREAARPKAVLAYAARHGCPADFPVWVTEYGVATAGGVAFTDRGEYANYGHPVDLTHDQAAAIITEAVERIRRECPSVERLYYYSLIDSGDVKTARENNFGLLDRGGVPKAAVAAALKALV